MQGFLTLPSCSLLQGPGEPAAELWLEQDWVTPSRTLHWSSNGPSSACRDCSKLQPAAGTAAEGTELRAQKSERTLGWWKRLLTSSAKFLSYWNLSFYWFCTGEISWLILKNKLVQKALAIGQQSHCDNVLGNVDGSNPRYWTISLEREKVESTYFAVEYSALYTVLRFLSILNRSSLSLPVPNRISSSPLMGYLVTIIVCPV